MKRRWSTVVIVVLFLLGCCVLLYPIVSDFWNFNHQSRVAAVYEEAVRQIEEKDYDAMLEAAQAYNESLLKKASRFAPTDEEDAYYRSLLVMERTDVMAVLEIPSINVYLPVYHGTDDDVLQSGIGHLQGSSLPIGGPGTHAVLSGHRGLPSSKLLSDLNLMQVGDRFVIHVLGKVLVYETDQIEVVLPSEMQSLAITEGEDYVTLLTCTPYGINTHRLLVRGHYVETLTQEESRQSGVSNASYKWKPDRSELLALIPVPFLIGALVMLLKKPAKKKKKGNSSRRKNNNSSSN
ncbi:MAG: class C sortase, partial [Clostridiales bacterium]|nr:class C sortase [Clostridiales bacterium]